MMGYIGDLIRHIATILGCISINYDEQIVREGLLECHRAVKKIRKELRDVKTIGEKQRLTSALNNIISFRAKFKSMMKSGAGGRKETARDRVHWDDSFSAFRSRLRTGVISNLRHKDPKNFLTDCKSLFKIRVKNTLKTSEAVKVNAAFSGDFTISTANKSQTEVKYFTTSNAPIYRDTNLDEWYTNHIAEPILRELEEFQEKDSGWSLTRITNLGVNINKFTPQRGSSYISLPAQIRSKHACVNVKNDDDACFAWAVTSALYPVNVHSDRVSSYPHYSTVLKLKGIQFPMTDKQIQNFEKQNGLSINVYILKKQRTSFDVLPTYLTKDKSEKHINLLLIQNEYFDEDSNDELNVPATPIRYHYVWIKDLSRLVSRQLSSTNGKKFICDRCLRYFYSEEKLDAHTEYCKNLNDCAIEMPKIGKHILEFKNFKNKESVPFILYADVESVLKPLNEKQKYQEHVPAAIGYYVKCSYDESLSFYRSYRGTDCTKWFAHEMSQLADDLAPVFWCSYDIDISSKQETEFRKATHCHICEKAFSSTDKKVRDHNHLIPENNYRGAAHEGCNILYRDARTIPVVFHNLSGYDSHLIFEDIALKIDGKISVLPVTKEKYISFTKHIDGDNIQFRFIDSFRFMNSSLDTLASYLLEFPNLRREFSDLPEDTFKLLTNKGVYPYDFMDSFEKFDFECLPSKEKFYNRLMEEHISMKHYKHAQYVWDSFNIKNLGEYTDLYLKTDVMLLADVFEQFRSSCLKTYSLDPAHYYTLPGYTWDAMLKYTKCKLELLTDFDHFLFVEKGIRGGLSQVCAKRKADANNRYMPNYDSTKSERYLTYYDVNNQYGWAMSQQLPYGGFKWVDNVENFDVSHISDDADVGFILEVDLEYPQHLHDIHKDLPFCPEREKPPGSKSPKLMATLHNKNKYIIHYRALKQALQHGLKLTKIHRVLKFQQSSWLKPYIDLNTKLRMSAKNDFEKNLFKLMNNAVFGKTMENIRRRVDVRLVTKWDGRYGAEALIAKPEFKSVTIFKEDLVAIEFRKLKHYLNKPIYVGMSILDLAKTTIYDFHYGYMRNRFGDNCSVLYTDTDSLIYEIYQDPYIVMRQDCYLHFDTSDYPSDNRYGIPQVNKKVLGMMKDELNGEIMTHFVGLRSKLYTFLVEGGKCIKKSKGIKKSVVKTYITYDDFVTCLENSTQKVVTQNLIRSAKHQVHSITQQKVALSPHDNKRNLLPGSYETLPWGHYSLSTRSSESVSDMQID